MDPQAGGAIYTVIGGLKIDKLCSNCYSLVDVTEHFNITCGQVSYGSFKTHTHKLHIFQLVHRKNTPNATKRQAKINQNKYIFATIKVTKSQ